MSLKKCLALGLLVLFSLPSPAWTFSFFEKRPYSLAGYVNREVYIDRVFQASDGIYKLNIAILIPEGLDFMTVIVRYDQLKEKKLTDIAWVKLSPSKSFFHFFKNKKDGFKKIFPFSKEEFVKAKYEPNSKKDEHEYDRAVEQNYEVYKKYQFYTKEIFGDGKKKSDHLLEFHYADGTKRAINIREDVYRNERLKPGEKLLPSFFGEGAKPNPVFAPNPVLPEEARDEAREEYNEFLDRQNETIKSRNAELYQKTIEEIEKTYGQGTVPDYDGLYRD